MIVKENRTVTAICNLNIGDTFRLSNSYFMIVYTSIIEADSGKTFCVDLETGVINQLKLSTAVEMIECECHVKEIE